MISGRLLGCSTARNKGTCSNRLNIRREVLEASVLDGLREHLMEPGLFKEFCEEFTRAVNRQRVEMCASLDVQRVELKKIERELEKLMQLYLNDAMPVDMVKERSGKLEARKNAIETTLVQAEEPAPLLHPSLAEMYRAKVTALHEALASDETRAAAAEILRSMICTITLAPENGELTINLRGDLAAMLSYAANGKPASFAAGGLGVAGSLVAGTRNCLDLLLSASGRSEVYSASQLAETDS